MSTLYQCHTSACDECFCVTAASRWRFNAFHEPGEPAYDCVDCWSDGYGYRRICPACCTRLAEDAVKQEIKDPRIASDRGVWVEFLRHCAGHGGYTVQY